MINFARLERTLMQDEGFRAEPYKCTAGVVTQGYGATILVDRGVDANGADIISLFPAEMDGAPIMEMAARELLRSNIYTAIIDAQDIFVRFDEMNAIRQEVLVNMAFNLGKTRLSKFRRMIAALKIPNYHQAANQMESSKWFWQVGNRAKRLVSEMRNDTMSPRVH